ncbi:P-loop containing nucleoside triphosphate hydrolase protein [Mycena metata]|uniref:P-loop containing nucleoside triphosphate hydrolase protein n=1 Tax=Mycena metata TaxID=1033252 RepID=A0AAD7KA96_9AGAR|nr:P-loop containing nucleoside triphosphate hydrolase protein [Mycena metata]
MDPYSRSRYEQGIDSKIVIMGNSGVGKTSLLQRYTQNKFDPKNTTSTSGAFFVTKKVYVNGLKVRLQLWDTAGQERFRSMAPMYYRGANAALLLYDITNASTFDDIRGWLEELKKNCQPELIIYIVGSKADLSPHRQVTSDLARLSLHNWFPPPRAPTPPPPPPPQLSTLSYIRPRFTSFPGLRSPPVNTPTRTTPPPDTPAYLDLQANNNSNSNSSRQSALSRSNTTASSTRPPLASAGSSRTTVSSTARQQSRFGSHFGFQAGGWSELQDSSSNSLNEDDENAADDAEDEREWGLSKGMELFEVSAKDDLGIQNLFDHLIAAIIVRKDRIEQENELKKRDSVFLTAVPTPAWAAQAEEEEAREKAERERSARGSWTSCC